MSRGAVIAALEGELKPLTRGWKSADLKGGALWSRRSGGTEWACACAGAGAGAAERAFLAAEKGGRLDWAVSIGWAGALDPKAVPGRAYGVAEVVDAATGERFSAASLPAPRTGPDPDGGRGWRLVSAPRVAGREEKQRLRRDFGADLVDMEAAAVARLARDRGIPFYCVKGVSDGAGERLPDLNRFLDPDGRFHTARFAAYALFRPAFWPGMIRLGVHSGRAAEEISRLFQGGLAGLPP